MIWENATCPTCGRELIGIELHYGSKWDCYDCSTEVSDILHCERGTKIIFSNPNNGWESDKERAKRYLEKGKIYTVENLIVGGSSSDVILQEIPNVKFNTVHFERVDQPEIVFVTSLSHGILNLSTQKHGEGRIYRFNHFGDSQTVLKKDFDLIMTSHLSFFEGGLFSVDGEEYHCDNSEEIMINVKDFKYLLSAEPKIFELIFKNMISQQKTTLAYLLADKMVDDDFFLPDKAIINLIDNHMRSELQMWNGLKMETKIRKSAIQK